MHGTNSSEKVSTHRHLIAWLLIVIFLTVPFAACTVPTGASTSTAAPTVASASEQGSNGDCGKERWAVKTMSDSTATQVNLTPIDTTIPYLTGLAAPKKLPENGRVVPTEFNTYRITARLVEAKVEDDKDIHLVIADPKNSSDTMIVELPSPTCPAVTGSRVQQQISTVRQEFVGTFGSPSTSRFERLSGTAQITGIGFFDFLHGQTGVAPNGIELHPVIDFHLLGGG